MILIIDLHHISLVRRPPIFFIQCSILIKATSLNLGNENFFLTAYNEHFSMPYNKIHKSFYFFGVDSLVRWWIDDIAEI